MENYQSMKKTARMAGLLFFILVVTGVFAEFFIRRGIVVYDDPVATANNIVSSEWMFRLGIVSDLIMSTAYFFFPLVLYSLFKDVNRNYTIGMILCVMISVTILCINMLNQIGALIMMTGSDFLGGFDTEQRQGMATFFLRMHGNGYKIAQIFFGLYLLPLGYLVYRSGFLPKIIGIFLMLGFAGDMIDFVRYFLFLDVQSVVLDNITLPADIGEISLCLFLLIKGIHLPKKLQVSTAT